MTDHDGPASPDPAPEPIGAVLKRMRLARKLTGKSLGELAGGMSQSKISRIENGITPAEPQDVRAIARALGADADLQHRLVEQADQSHNQMTDWRPTQPDVADRQNDVALLESSTKVLRVFQSAVIIGLLQSSEYANAIFSGFQKLGLSTLADSPATVAAAVSARVRRQETLYEEGRQFHFLMAESVFGNWLADPDVMVSQISLLRRLARRENVTVRIIPEGRRWDIPPYHGFELMDDRCVLVDLYNTSLMSRGRADIALYRRVFDSLEDLGTTDIDPILDKYRDLYRRRAEAADPPA